MSKICPKCGYVRDDDKDKDIPENECPRCGVIYAKAEAYKGEKRKSNTKNLKECPSCKKLIFKNAKFCPYCGESIKNNSGGYIALSIVLIALAVFIFKIVNNSSQKKKDLAKKNKYAAEMALKAKKQAQIKQAKLNSYENNTRFSESIRQKIWLRYLQAEHKATKEAEKTTQLMPELNPVSKQAALTNSLNIKYKKELAEQYEITLQQLEKIANEGLEKDWYHTVYVASLPKPKPKPKSQSDHYITKSGYYVASVSREALNQAIRYHSENDYVAFKKLLNSKKVFILTPGVTVYLEDVKVFSKEVKIRPVGETYSVWTMYEAIERK